MVKNNLKIGIILAMTLSSTASAQLPGDMNCNGWAWEIADVVLAARFLIETCEMYPPSCPENSNFDGDGRAFSIGDLLYYFYSDDPPQYSRHPGSDTLATESAEVRPGETIVLPVNISTIDTIMGFQFLLEVDPDYLVFDSLIADDNFHLVYCNFNGDIYCRTSYGTGYSPVITDPGNYHVCDLMLTVNPEVEQPATTLLPFSEIPHRAMYSGFANSDFFLPVLVDGEIQIIPETSIEPEDEVVPAEFRITAYPNPFNGALNISVYSHRTAAISIYDIIGRPVMTFGLNPGDNLIRWNATDIDGRSLSAGIYFIGNIESGKFEKVMYLK